MGRNEEKIQIVLSVCMSVKMWMNYVYCRWSVCSFSCLLEYAGVAGTFPVGGKYMVCLKSLSFWNVEGQVFVSLASLTIVMTCCLTERCAGSQTQNFD